MIESWVLFALAATVIQTVRFMLQKVVSTSDLSAGGATFSRFLYSAPIVWILALVILPELPTLAPSFWAFAIAGGLAQILATVCTVLLFQSRNFAVGITLKKTEVLLTVLIGIVILGEGVSWAGFSAMVLGVIGVLMLSDPPKVEGQGIMGLLASRAVVLGLTSGIFFGVSAVSYRGATLAVEAEPAIRALVALSFVLVVQVGALGAWLALRESGEITRVVRAWPRAIWIGLTSLGGSFCWFNAFTLENAGYAFAVGQLEVIFSLVASVYFFHETVTRKEIAGITLIFLSVVALIVVT